mgnify:CR=1 FL=1
MAIVRDYAKCTVCDCKFVLRIGVGIEEVWTHTFDCPNCHTPISVDLRTDKPGQAWVEPRESSEIIPMEEGVDLFVNLHPAFAFKQEDYRSQFAFASETNARSRRSFTKTSSAAGRPGDRHRQESTQTLRLTSDSVRSQLL